MRVQLVFRCIRTSIPHKFPPSLPPSVTLRSIWDSLTIPLLFLQCMKSCLPHVWSHVYNMFEVMFTLCLRSCLQHVWGYVYTMFEVLLKPCLESYLHHIVKHVKTSHVYTIFRRMSDITEQIEIRKNSKICLTNLYFA